MQLVEILSQFVFLRTKYKQIMKTASLSLFFSHIELGDNYPQWKCRSKSTIVHTNEKHVGTRLFFWKTPPEKKF